VADTDAGNAVLLSVLANDSSPNGSLVASSVHIVNEPAHGVALAARTGEISYTPSDGFAGTDRFTYTVTDSAGVVSSAGQVTIVVNRPTANDDFTDTDAGNPVIINVLENDTDPDGNDKLDPTSVNIVSGPTHGSVSVDGSTGSITYTPVDGFSGTDHFSYTVQDVANATSNPGQVNVVVNRPTANDDFTDTDAGNAVLIDVLANDTDPDGNDKLDPASVTLGVAPAHGSAAVDSATGEITYTPVDGFTGTDSFTYTVKDIANATSNPATVTVVVNRPTANDDFAETNSPNAVSIGVLENDTDPDGNDKLDPASVSVTSGPAHGSVTVDAGTGAVTYTPEAGFTGSDSFTYTVKDIANATSNPALVTIVVQGGGSTLLNDDAADTDAGNSVVIDVLGNDASSRGFNVSSLAVAQAPAHGSAVMQNGAITYLPAQGFRGTDSFTYTVRDNDNQVLGPATVHVVVNQPTANDDFTDTDAGNPVIINVLENDTDPDGNDKLDPATVLVVSGPAHGMAVVNPATGAITYTPVDGFSGTDSFRYTVRDVASAVSNPALVSVVVNRPTANDDFTDVDAGNPVVINVLDNDTDPDGNDKLNPATVSVASGPAHGSASVNPATGAITYTPQDGFSGTDSFTYTVQDVAGATSNAAQVTIVVNRPTANDDFADTDGTNPVSIDVLENDTDPDGNDKLDPTSVALASGPAHGSVAIDPATGVITYTPLGGFSGTDQFSYTVQDVANATSNPATVTVVVHLPAANADVATAFGTNSVTINVVANDTDPDGADKLVPGSVQVITGPSHGSLSVDSTTGLVTYTAQSGFVGTDAFTYTISDVHGAVSLPGTVTITVHSTHLIAFGVPIGGRPIVQVFDQQMGTLLYRLQPYAAGFRGGIRVTLADLTGDDVPDIITAPRSNLPSRVRVFDGTTGQALPGALGSFLAFSPIRRAGVRIAAGDVNGDGIADILTQTNVGSVRLVRVFSGADGGLLASFDSGAAGHRRRHVKVFGGLTVAQLDAFFASHQEFKGGFLG
jgi:hypothetical protein